MIRAVFFDFYSVWTPDRIGFYLANAELNGPEVYKELYDDVEQYYRGDLELEKLAEAFRLRLGHPDITPEALMLSEANISPEIVNFIRGLHGHFIKVGILANLGPQEATLLDNYNKHNQLFEVIASPLTMGVKEPLLTKDVFVRALQAIGEPPTSCLLISGNPYYLAFASSLEIVTLQFEGLAKLQTAMNQILATEMPQSQPNQPL